MCESSVPSSPSDTASADLADNAALSDDIVSVAKRDRAAFRRLYSASSGTLFAICLNITRNRAAAEDVLQDCYLKVWEKAPGFEPSRNRPLSWLATIARNTAVDWYRRQARHKHVGDEHLNSLASEAPAPDERIISRDRENEALAAVDDLDGESEREVKTIFLLGLTYVEAAERLNVPLATLKSRVRRAIIKIRGRLADD